METKFYVVSEIYDDLEPNGNFLFTDLNRAQEFFNNVVEKHKGEDGSIYDVLQDTNDWFQAELQDTSKLNVFLRELIQLN
jgi:hypothetical protein